MEKKKEKHDKMMKISKSVKDELATLRIIPEEPFGDVIRRLIKFYKEKNKDV